MTYITGIRLEKKENEKINWENGKIGDMANTEIRGNVLEENKDWWGEQNKRTEIRQGKTGYRW